MENMNSREYLDKIKYAFLFFTQQQQKPLTTTITTKRTKILENLRHLNFAPSVQMHQVPKDLFSDDDDEDEDNEENKDKRITRKSFCVINIYLLICTVIAIAMVERMSDKRRVPENELSDSEDEGDGRRNERSYKDSIMSHDKGPRYA